MEAQENSQTEQNAQAPKKRELALVSRSTYIKEKALQWIFFACAFLAVVTVILIFVFTTYSALPVFTDIGLADFFSFTWAPSEGHYGIMSLLAGSGLVTVGALALQCHKQTVPREIPGIGGDVVDCHIFPMIFRIQCLCDFIG